VRLNAIKHPSPGQVLFPTNSAPLEGQAVFLLFSVYFVQIIFRMTSLLLANLFFLLVLDHDYLSGTPNTYEYLVRPSST